MSRFKLRQFQNPSSVVILIYASNRSHSRSDFTEQAFTARVIPLLGDDITTLAPFEAATRLAFEYKRTRSVRADKSTGKYTRLCRTLVVTPSR